MLVQVLLKVLPRELLEWQQVLRERRQQYEQLKRRLNTNPRAKAFEEDPQLNNPLSLQDEASALVGLVEDLPPLFSQNPWQQFFLDEELRDCIRKDVERT